MQIDIERIIHSIKTGLACLVGFAITKALHAYLFFDQWLIVTILVVMCAQISVGGIFYKSTLRFIGTCAGSLLAAFAILSFSNDTLAYAAVIALAGMGFSYIATGQQSYSDVGTLGAVTTAIILINPDPTLSLTAERFLEITIGIIIATLISQFVLPIHARNHLRRSQAQALKLLGEYYRKTISSEKTEITELDENIVQSISTQRKLSNEAKRELLGSKFEPTQFKRLVECEKGILRSIDFLNRLYSESSIHRALENNPAWQTFNQNILSVFAKLAQQVEKPQFPPDKVDIPSIGALKDELAKTSTDQKDENLEQGFALFFCLESITKQLKELATVVANT